MDDLAPDLDLRRIAATAGMDRAHRSTFGQFFTSTPIADYMASLVVDDGGSPAILDPGAGIGMLSASLLTRLHGRGVVTAYELEHRFIPGLERTLSGFPGTHQVMHRDFIEQAVRLIAANDRPRYDVAILNPPYNKIPTGSTHRTLVRKIGVETSNLYTCFLACAIALCRKGAQVVAIIPRSWMNGPYFKPFRYWLFEHAAIAHIHIFKSRDKAFGDDAVLQENVIIKLIVGAAQGDVKISASHDQTLTDISQRLVPFSAVVTPNDEECFIHVPTLGTASTTGLPGKPLREIGLDICTGPVVDFRLKSHLLQEPSDNSVPLLYATHFSKGQIEWPKAQRKPNAIMVNAETRSWLMPNGCYVLLKRFTSKEEKRRVVAYVLQEGELPGALIGFENHLNVMHQDKHGLEPDLAKGMAAYLNSKAVDDYFRTFSGHTQVNATDLRRLRYPSLEQLRKMGRENA